MLVYGECECFVMQMLYVCVLCASCGSSQCCVLHDLQFECVNYYIVGLTCPIIYIFYLHNIIILSYLLNY